MRKKFIYYYMILVIVGITVTGSFISVLAQRIYKNEVEIKLKTTAFMLKSHISEALDKGEKLDYNQIAIKYAAILHLPYSNGKSPEKNSPRITFIDYRGNVLGESENNFKEMENHLERKEIQEAILGNVGEDMHFSKTLKTDFLYIAVPIEKYGIITRVSLPLLQLKKIDQIIWLYTLSGIIAGLILTFLLAFRFSSNIIRPVRDLIAAAGEISNGNYNKRAVINSNDELGELAETFNNMAVKLEGTVSDLVDKNARVDSIINSLSSGIIAVDNKQRIILLNSVACKMFGIKSGPGAVGVNIIELIRNHRINSLLNETLESGVSQSSEIVIGPPEDVIYRVNTNPILAPDSNSFSGAIASVHDITNIRKLEQIRSEFVSNVTHELKTPLTSIRGFIETLKGGALKDPKVADRFLDIIDIEADRLYMLINDILQLSEIETKQNDTDIGVHSFNRIADEVISVLSVTAGKKNITIDSDIEEDMVLTVNRDRIKQMLINLIDNSIKYNTENGKVLITGRKTGSKAVITVKDTGIGIPEEYLHRIFERFYRVDKGRSRSMGGTGLGLSIVKHIVNLYNGDIKVSSKPGKGTEFIIQLPC